MFSEVGAQHHTPHFHAYYQEDVGILQHRTRRTDCGIVAETSTTIGRGVGGITPTGINGRLEHIAGGKDTRTDRAVKIGI